MAFYTLALTALTAVPAALVWHPVAAADLPALLAIGVLAQVGQYCFVRAHHLASAGVLAPLGYLHLGAGRGRRLRAVRRTADGGGRGRCRDHRRGDRPGRPAAGARHPLIGAPLCR